MINLFILHILPDPAYPDSCVSLNIAITSSYCLPCGKCTTLWFISRQLFFSSFTKTPPIIYLNIY